MHDNEVRETTRVQAPAEGETRSLAKLAVDVLEVGAAGITVLGAGTQAVIAVKDKLSAPKDEGPKVERPAGYDHD